MKSLLKERRKLTVLALFFLCGCAGTESQNKDFYTSGSNEADQRADQRMAQAEQFSSEGGGIGSAMTGSEKSLYDRLGGQQGLAAIADDFVTRAMADPRVNFTRKGVIQGGLSIHRDKSMEWNPTPDEIKALKLHLAQFFALASGGPTKYEGQPVKESHANMHISNAEFDAAVGDLKATLDKLQIANTEQKELLAIAETTRAQIVEEQ